MPNRNETDLASTLLNHAERLGGKLPPDEFEKGVQSFLTVFAQCSPGQLEEQYLGIMFAAQGAGKDIHVGGDVGAAIKYLTTRAMAAKALEILSVMSSAEPTWDELNAMLERAGFWNVFEKPADKTQWLRDLLG